MIYGCSPIDFQSYVFWEPTSQVDVLKGWAPDMRSIPFTLQQGAGSCEFPPSCGVTALGMEFMVILFLSFSYLNPIVGFSSFSLCIGDTTKLVSRFISEEIVPYVAVDMVFLARK